MCKYQCCTCTHPCTESHRHQALYPRLVSFMGMYCSREPTPAAKNSRKWWLRPFYFLLDTVVVNSCILYNETPGTKPLTLKEFVVALSENMMSMYSSRKRRTFTAEVPSASRLCKRHFPDQIPESKQCRVCLRRKRTQYCCSDCSPNDPIPLCPTKCFKAYHTMPFLPREKEQ